MTPLEVVAAVIIDGGRVLACRRRIDLAAGGRWEFPGGKIERGETPASALVREIREELGIGILVGAHLRSDDTDVAGRVIRLHCLRATLAGSRPTASLDHDRLAWVRPTELSALDWADPDLPMVRELTGAAVRD